MPTKPNYSTCHAQLHGLARGEAHALSCIHELHQAELHRGAVAHAQLLLRLVHWQRRYLLG